MQKRSTLVVLVALLSIFGYFTWEHYSERKYQGKEREHEERQGEDVDKEAQRNLSKIQIQVKPKLIYI
jgi:hypothetical protein